MSRLNDDFIKLFEGGGYYDCSKKIDCTLYYSTALKDV